MGSVDKFGRSPESGASGSGGSGSNKSMISLRGPKGEGFVLDKNGHFLVSHKRIKQLADPEDNLDAVNKQWLESRIKPIEERFGKFELEKKDFELLCREATDIGEKALARALGVERTIEGFSSRIREVQDLVKTSSIVPFGSSYLKEKKQ